MPIIRGSLALVATLTSPHSRGGHFLTMQAPEVSTESGAAMQPAADSLYDESSLPQAQWPVPLIAREDSAEQEKDSHEMGPGRILLIYTGGTMGMTLQNESLTPLKGYLPQCIREMPEVHEPSMPEIDIVEYEPLIDSSNIGPEDWATLAAQVRDNYYDYDGFVIIHGTDTMAYTASALSFMLEGLGKAVVITGSMIPLAEIYNDARRNLLISMVFAAQLELCEVAIFFNDRLVRHGTGTTEPPPRRTASPLCFARSPLTGLWALSPPQLRGNRATKVDSNGLDAFDSPNFPPLATVGARISSDRALWRRPPTSRLRVHTILDTSIVVVSLVPGFDDSAIETMVEHCTNLKGLVLSLYGTGNGPSRKAAFLDTISKAISRGIFVVRPAALARPRPAAAAPPPPLRRLLHRRCACFLGEPFRGPRRLCTRATAAARASLRASSVHRSPPRSAAREPSHSTRTRWAGGYSTSASCRLEI